MGRALPGSVATRSTRRRSRNGWRRNLASLRYQSCSIRKGALAANPYLSRSSPVRSEDTCQQHENGIFVRSTGRLNFREKYSFFDASSGVIARVIWLTTSVGTTSLRHSNAQNKKADRSNPGKAIEGGRKCRRF